MTAPMAFRAAFSDMKLVKTRQVAQLIFEIPLSDFDAAYEVLGGLPDPSKESWFAVAPLAAPRSVPDKPQTGAKRDWRDMQPQQQAGIRCAEPIFGTYLKEHYPKHYEKHEGDNAKVIRDLCGVHSRVELGTNHKARTLWHQIDQQFQAWKQVEHA